MILLLRHLANVASIELAVNIQVATGLYCQLQLPNQFSVSVEENLFSLKSTLESQLNFKAGHSDDTEAIVPHDLQDLRRVVCLHGEADQARHGGEGLLVGLDVVNDLFPEGRNKEWGGVAGGYLL